MVYAPNNKNTADAFESWKVNCNVVNGGNSSVVRELSGFLKATYRGSLWLEKQKKERGGGF